MTTPISYEDYEALWAEIRALREAIDSMRLQRETLIKHHAELGVLHEQLTTAVEQTQAMADEVKEMLDGRGTE